LSPTDPVVASESASEQLVDVDVEMTIAVDENVVESIAVASEQQIADDGAMDQPESADGLPLLGMVAGALAEGQTDADVSVAAEHSGEFEYVNRAGVGPAVVVIGGGV